MSYTKGEVGKNIRDCPCSFFFNTMCMCVRDFVAQVLLVYIRPFKIVSEGRGSYRDGRKKTKLGDGDPSLGLYL